MHYFSPEDMQVKEKHYRPMYYIGYIRSAEVSRIQVNLGFSLSIIPHRVIQHLRILTHRLSATQLSYMISMPTYASVDMIKLRSHISDLNSELMCYVINVDTSYILLLDDHGSTTTLSSYLSFIK